MVREPIERLKEKILKENLWIFIFKILKEKDEYAYEIRKKIKKEFGFLAGNVTAYKVLYLLERHGFIEKIKIKHTSGGPERKYYKILPKGIELLFEGRDILEYIINTLWES